MRRILGETLSLATAAAVVLAVNFASPDTDAAPAAQVDTAAVTVINDTARSVEQVSYSSVVERVGDVVLFDGRPVEAITDPELRTAWSLVDAVWPTAWRDELTQLSVIRDGPLGLVGVVHTAADGGWILSLDAADLDQPEMVTETIVHELVHVETLAPEQFSFGQVAECEGLVVELGCAAIDSALARFSERFWPEGTPLDTGADSFVTTYAASAVHEDLAETFTALVFEWPVAAGTLAAEKIAFLAADPDLAGLHAELSSLGAR